jgi:hypothetical protein
LPGTPIAVSYVHDARVWGLAAHRARRRDQRRDPTGINQSAHRRHSGARDQHGHALRGAILLLCWGTIGWMRPTTTRVAWSIGALWVTLTLAFEFLAGHYVFGTPWRQLLADYNIFRGRIWVLVLVTTATAPWLAAHGRGLRPPQT